MRWNFWNRRSKRTTNGQPRSTPENAAPAAASGQGSNAPFRQALFGSHKDLLGLQRLVGNQQVLRLLDCGERGADNHEPAVTGNSQRQADREMFFRR